MASGESIGHYEILAKVGAGGMGEVFRAHDTKLGREVALKVLPEEFTRDPERHLRFHREAQFLAAFTHNNVAAIHSLEEDGDRHFLVMELVEGEDLATRLSQGPLPVAETLVIARQITTALEAAHAKGIVHRDLKPQNVMVTPVGVVKILDFGLAKVYTDDDDASAITSRTATALDSPTVTPPTTRIGALLGTAAYMSPEQARGKAVDKQTDIWAFGCVLYEMLTGQQAFPGQTNSDILAAVLKSEPDWSALPRSLPPGLIKVLHRCLRKDRPRRLHDIADARLEIDEILGGAELADGVESEFSSPDSSWFPGYDALPPSGEDTTHRPVRRWVAVTGWLLAAALAVGLGWLLLQASPRKEPVRLQTFTYSGRDWAPSASPLGDVIAFTSDRDGTPRIWLKQVAGGGEEPLTAGPDDYPRFSPDGSQLLFVRDEGTQRNLYRTSVVGAQPRKLLEDVAEADWSPDGEQVAFVRMVPENGENVGVIGIADAQTGQERILARVEHRFCYGVRWSPDGTQLAFNETSLTGNIAENSYIDLIDVASGVLQHLTLSEWQGSFTAIAWAPTGTAFVVGQATNMLAHVTDAPSLIMAYDLGSAAGQPLFWSPVRLPRGGFSFSTLDVLGPGRIVLDAQTTHAELREASLGGSAEAGAARALTRGLGIDRQPAFSPDGRHVIFSSNRSGNIDLWLVDRLTGELQQLTDDEADDWDPAFTPDGHSIIWSSDRSGNMEIWLAAADGSRARQITNDGMDAENPTMTRDGQWIVYASGHDEKLGIWKIRPDGSEATHLTAGSYLLPEISPDGRHALFTQFLALGYVIKVAAIESGEMLPFEIDLTAPERHINVVPGRARWVPDGDAIVYIGFDAANRSGVFQQDFLIGQDTTPTRRKLAGFTMDYVTESLGIAPDGRTLVISAMYDRRTIKLADHVRLKGWE